MRKLLAAALVAAFVPTASFAADHMDSPLVKNDPAADINDVYTFVNPADPDEVIVAVTLLPVATRNSRLSDAVEYRIHLDNGATPNTIVCTFTESGTRYTCAGAGGLAASGPIGRTNEGTGMRAWVGLRDDPFFFDLDAFNETKATLTPRFTDPGEDFFLGLNTEAIVLGIDRARLNNGGANNVVKVYASTNRVGGTGLNGGYTGHWWDPGNPGHGVFLQVLAPGETGGPNRLAVLWAVYDNAGNQVYALGIGDIAGNTATVPLSTTRGGRLPPQVPPSPITMPAFGSLSFTFDGCASGSMRFVPTSAQQPPATIPLMRLTAIAGVPCDPLLVAGQIDRMGRPGINTALIDLLASTGKKDLYNKASDPATWAAQFQSEMQTNLAALDTLDGTTGNTLLPPATAAQVLVDDRLVIDTSKATCDAYLAVETGAAQCGGRTLRRDVIDDTLGAVVGPGVSDNVDFDSTLLTDFPFLGEPN